ncbi:ABC transporter substrate-binding protein [Arthrobacter jinronghuae]|uniref:ABC transporter substrate-binding protein n=1 Tax=Arthrobacter jinronghuae TaxID=2964609 RepID=A0ABT1NR03_9MICC|nr:ABC transporter substrate-binding protein [Arthrobacter jinronghuae]MCQ1950128.1 ABC transporter substrate-binding protein [Arthrobacter jinronghuae]MCQ1953473.1 ABC transporter substrate-binding protein [Arthrobacter sp. zg-Y238]MCQ1956706.1 ABC transporter substrate-binding protein [Arthrobacter jinronghuae]UWX77116.1 ABC transporter substrate-binding protein [Arthrobacter jinronghuae]
MKNFRHPAAAIAGAAVVALLAVGCGGGDSEAASEDNPLKLTVTTFGTFGYDDLYAEYEEANPGIDIQANNIDRGANAQTDLFTKLAAGSGVSDVVALEEGWLGAVMDVSDQFVDLNEYGAEDIKDNWVDWKYKQGTDADGRVIGYGTDIGPQGLCYNGKLFEEAGLPSDREAVAELFGGDDATWDTYFELGNQYHEKTGKAWYDQSGFVWNSMVNQMKEGYYTADGDLNIEGNDAMKEQFMQLAAGTQAGLSANETKWDWGTGKAFTDGSFATFVCPGWMLGTIQEQLESAGGGADSGWDFADVFPGGASNWGGAFLAVPETSEHKEEAAKLAAWLTAPEQQVKQSAAANNFPSTIEAQEQLAEDATPNPMFNNAPTGAILASRAEGVVAQFKGPDDSVIQEKVFGVALTQLDSGKVDGEGAWNEAVQLLNELVVKD